MGMQLVLSLPLLHASLAAPHTSETKQPANLQPCHDKNRGNHGVEVSPTDRSSCVNHHWQQYLHGHKFEQLWSSANPQASSTCQLSAQPNTSIGKEYSVTALTQGFEQLEQTRCHGVYIRRFMEISRCMSALTICAAMMSPMVKAASVPAYVLAIATAPHDMKLNTACHVACISILSNSEHCARPCCCLSRLQFCVDAEVTISKTASIM